ncbi:membrane-fusion domain protein, partial [Vibrio parahaemolyticus V-223/04]
LLMW